MPRNTEIEQIVEEFKGKVERARLTENYTAEVHKAVEELVHAIGAAVSKLPQPEKDPEKGMKMALENFRTYTEKNPNIPKGVQTMLENLAARKK